MPGFLLPWYRRPRADIPGRQANPGHRRPAVPGPWSLPRGPCAVRLVSHAVAAWPPGRAPWAVGRELVAAGRMATWSSSRLVRSYSRLVELGRVCVCVSWWPVFVLPGL